MAVDPLSGTAYVTGKAFRGAGSESDYATVAYARNGSQLWATRYDGGVVGLPEAIALDGRRGIVYVTGRAEATPGERKFGYRTVAYTVGGDLLRVDDFRVPDSVGIDYAEDIAVDPRNGQVYVTGQTWVLGGDTDFTTVAYPPAGGAALMSLDWRWSQRRLRSAIRRQ